MDDLKHQVMINQFASAVGCLSHEAKEHLKSSHWQYEIALSRYFQESGIPPPRNHPLCAPTNTPATPPGFPETLLGFSKMQGIGTSPPQTNSSSQQSSSKSQNSSKLTGS